MPADSVSAHPAGPERSALPNCKQREICETGGNQYNWLPPAFEFQLENGAIGVPMAAIKHAPKSRHLIVS
jgi:hypothetical protein